MRRFGSTFTMAGWAGFHAASAALLLSTASSAIPLDPATGFIAFGHACAGVGAFAILAMLRARSEQLMLDASLAVVLLASLGLAALGHADGSGGGQPGLFAFCVAATLAAFRFDRSTEGGDEEVDHEAFMREAARLGASLSPRHQDDRAPGGER